MGGKKPRVVASSPNAPGTSQPPARKALCQGYGILIGSSSEFGYSGLLLPVDWGGAFAESPLERVTWEE